MVIEIRRIRPGDGPLLEQVRLAALLDSPFAFARTHAEESGRGDDEWERLAVERSSGGEGASWFALADDAAVGIVGGFRAPGEAGVELVSMWTHPDHRRKGVGERLVAAVIDFADAEEVRLWVTRGNEPARWLYERCGFTITEEARPLPSDPCKEEVRMRRRPG